MIIPEKIKKGDTIGIIAPSNPIIDENVEEVEKAKEIMQQLGYRVKYSRNFFDNTNRYSSTAELKAEDINEMFADNEVKMIWCAKGGENSNSTFDYIDYELIKHNPKIICGYSDITSITNVISQRTGLVTFSGTNFKTIATDETEYSLREARKRFEQGSLELGTPLDKYLTIRSGYADGALIGGNLSLMRGLVAGKYAVDFRDKILFIEELGMETGPALVSNHLYYMKQNGIFDQIKGIWVGNYTHESQITLEDIILDTLRDEYRFPIIKSENFGHIERKTVIPIGTRAVIDTSKETKIQLVERCVL